MRPYATIVFVLISRAVFADGGTVQLRQESGPFVITVFTTPSPLRAGPVDVSIMIQNRGDLQPVLDADVSVRINGSTLVRATHDQAQNKLLYAAPVTLDKPGKWNYTIEIKFGATATIVSGTLDVGPQQNLLASAWTYLALPPLLIAIFILRERLIRVRQ